jgi:hypothetical protein
VHAAQAIGQRGRLRRIEDQRYPAHAILRTTAMGAAAIGERAAPAVPEALWAAVHAAAAGEPWPPSSERTAGLLLEQAGREGLLPLLFAAPALPDVVRAALERQRALLRLAEARAQIFAGALRALAGLLDGEPFVVLKGADYMRRLYPRPALRPMQDIDLLVPRDRLDAVCERLLAGGLRRRAPTRAAREAPSYYERAFLLGDVIVEAHQAFLQESRHPVDYGAVWARRVPCPDLSPTAARLGDVDAVAYHALAMAKDELTVPLVRFVDLRLMLQADPHVLRVAAARAREWKAARALYAALVQLRGVFPDLAGGEVESVERELQGPLARRFLARWVLPPPSERGRAGAVTRGRQLWRKLWLLDNTRRRLAFAVQHTADTARGWIRRREARER